MQTQEYKEAMDNRWLGAHKENGFQNITPL